MTSARKFRRSHLILNAVALLTAGLIAGGCATSKVAKPAPDVSVTGKTDSTSVSIFESASKSLVVVRYVFDGEAGRREFEGVGTIVAVDGTTMTTIGLFPAQMPDGQITDVKIVLPGHLTGDDEREISAEFLGRDERADVAFVRPATKKPSTTPSTKPTTMVAELPLPTFTPLSRVSTEKLTPGQLVYGVGLLPKGSGYASYLTQGTVSSTLRGPVPQVLVAGRLPVVGSPVFDASGAWIGFVQVQEGQIPILNNPQNEMAPLMLPPIFFVPASDFSIAINDLPKDSKRREVPHVGIGQMTGLNKEVALAYGLASTAAIQVGDVPPGFPAADAGVKSGDIIVSINGKPLERGDLPEELPMIMVRRLQRFNVGDIVTLGIVREPNTPPTDLKLTLGAKPMMASQAARYFAEDLGFASRDLVFDDKYRNKLDASFAGVAIAFVKPQSAAQAGGLRPNDYVTRLNQTPVTSVDQFKQAYQAFRKSNVKDAVVFEVQRGVDTQIIRIEPPR